MSVPKNVKQLTAPTFALLVKQLRRHQHEADAFEIDLDQMRIKGDLGVIHRHFGKPIIARTTSLDWAKRAAKAGLPFLKLPPELELDLEFTTLIKNKGVTLL